VTSLWQYQTRSRDFGRGLCEYLLKVPGGHIVVGANKDTSLFSPLGKSGPSYCTLFTHPLARHSSLPGQSIYIHILDSDFFPKNVKFFKAIYGLFWYSCITRKKRWESWDENRPTIPNHEWCEKRKISVAATSLTPVASPRRRTIVVACSKKNRVLLRQKTAAVFKSLQNDGRSIHF
jgi:hypothetical protein